MPSNHRYFILNKPAGIVSQFISSHQVGLLGDLNHDWPEGIHAIGRLDKDTEGLLILTTNKKVTQLLFQGVHPHERTYLVQVRQQVSEATLQQLRTGVPIEIKGGEMYTTPPCRVELIQNPERLYTFNHVVHEYEPFSWMTITITEGKYHQVRKMTKAVKHRCKRLIRLSIEELVLGDLAPGGIKELMEDDFFSKLKIKKY